MDERLHYRHADAAGGTYFFIVDLIEWRLSPGDAAIHCVGRLSRLGFRDDGQTASIFVPAAKPNEIFGFISFSQPTVLNNKKAPVAWCLIQNHMDFR
ncbi:hypothetical protein [Candidatus Nitrotoga sp. M5]|uniref:hypothetical protein n=1 Tax=Candidatus Nitrotoga sp. M5 TaxID=2890409 RepID=UPI001EF47F91|nr:hypothetical protein [Candidatus Nitrotoga sp. M5]